MDKRFVENAVRNYADSLLKIAYSYTKSTYDAEDIVQEVFLSMTETEKDFISQEHLKAWLIRITINKSKNHVKSTWIAKRLPMPEEVENFSNEDYLLLDAVFALDKKYRIPIHLFYYEGYSIKEISEILGRSPATVGSWLDRGRKKLKKLFRGDLIEKQI